MTFLSYFISQDTQIRQMMRQVRVFPLFQCNFVVYHKMPIKDQGMVVMASMDVIEIPDDTAPPQNMDDLRKKSIRKIEMSLARTDK